MTGITLYFLALGAINFKSNFYHI